MKKLCLLLMLLCSVTAAAREFNKITITVGNVQFKMILVKHGSFIMGGTSEQSRPDNCEAPTHNVTISEDYYIGETEVTQELWDAVLSLGPNPSHFRGDKNPVNLVSWDDAMSFIDDLHVITGLDFRLPTEAEWEYAARGGHKARTTQYSGSSSLGAVAWYKDNSYDEAHQVATKAPNELGIYDMSGNVWEWCEDYFGTYNRNDNYDPEGPSNGKYHVYRGGSWNGTPWYCRVSTRGWEVSYKGHDDLGFRLVLPAYNVPK